MIPKPHYNVYIADCVNSGGIYHFDFSGGILSLKGKTNIDRPMYLAIEDNRIYTVLRAPFDDNDCSGIMYYNLDASGKLCKPSDIISTDGTVACHLCVRNGIVFDANYVSGSVNKLGKKTVAHSGKGINPVRQDKAHVHFTNFSPEGKYIFVCDLGLDTIFVYDNELNEISKAKVPDGHGVRHLAYSEDGKTVYSVNELESTISVFNYIDGNLEYVTTVAGLPDDFRGINTAAAIRIVNDRMYVSHRGYDQICVFDISEKIPKLVNHFKSGGKSPRDFIAIDDYIIVTNESGTICVFDKKKFSLLQTVTVSSPLCVIGKNN